MELDAVLACDESLQRSRARRRRLALAVERVTRRRRRRSTTTLAALTAAVAVAAPLAVAHRTTATKSATPAAAGQAAQVQRALGIAQTGTWDARTRRAVRAFQRRNGLLVDGIVGPQTLGALGLTGRAPTRVRSSSRGSLLARIAQCESGGNPAAISPDGRYRGKYQFSRATWRSLGGTGDPAKAPEATQDEMAAKLLAQAGTSPWPSCA